MGRKANTTNFENEQYINDCELIYAVNLVAGRWKMLILCKLSYGTKRFGELSKSMEGITERMLTLQLRELEKDGLVKRTVYAQVPPKVEYELTSIAEELVELWQPLDAWGSKHKKLNLKDTNACPLQAERID